LRSRDELTARRATGDAFTRSDSFLDPWWDRAAKEDVDEALLALFTRQIAHARSTTPFWRERLAALAPGGLTRDAIEQIPVLTKDELRGLGTFDLLPSPHRSMYLVRGTGGTTGTPTHIFWTEADWRASQQTMARFADGLEGLRPLLVWNGYHQAHVSGPAFDDLVRGLGGTPVPRHFRLTDGEAIDEIERVRANALIITPRSGSGKGGSLEDLLTQDATFLSRLRIRALLVSSTRLEREMADEAREQGVETIINFYGSTEAPPAAISCPGDPTVFHLCQGNLFVEVVDEQGRHVRTGEAGMVVVSRIGSAENGAIACAQGTQLFRFAPGDRCTFIADPCSCGRSSARIANIERVQNRGEKLAGGCERWE